MSVDTAKIYNTVIIGSGPAGHTAAIYAARAELAPIMFEGFMAGGVAAGGQLTTTTEIENFPGFPNGLGGPELMDAMREQSINLGTKIITQTISKVDFSKNPFLLWTEGAEEEKPVQTKTVIIATGATAKRMNLPGEDTYWQRGISACAVCDGALPIYRDVPLAVIGGGDSACEEASFLTKFGSKVYLVHRRDELRASKAMQKRVKSNPKIEILWNTKPESVHGDQHVINSLHVIDSVTAKKREIQIKGLFYAIGHKPNTDAFVNQLDMDETGYLITKPGTTITNIDGVFAAGDVQDKTYRQAITAAGTGCMAALDAEKYLETLKD